MTSAEFGPFSGPKAKNATRWCCNCAPAVSACCPRLSASIVMGKVSSKAPLQRRLERLPYPLHIFLAIIIFVLALCGVSDHTGDAAPRGLSASSSIYETNRIYILMNKYDRPLTTTSGMRMGTAVVRIAPYILTHLQSAQLSHAC
jgi:hypothetical protein